MQKVRIVCLEKDRRGVVSTLYKAGILHLKKSALDLSDDSDAEYTTALSDIEIRLAGALALIKMPKKQKNEDQHEQERHLSAEELIARFSDLESVDRTYQLNDERRRTDQSIKQIEQSEHVARQISGLDINLDRLRSGILSFKAYAAHDHKSIIEFKDEVSKNRLAAEVVASTQKGQESLLVAYKKGIDIDELARAHGLRELDLTLDHMHGTPQDSLERIAKEKHEMSERIKSIDNELVRISASDYRKLSTFMEMLTIEMTKAQVSEMFKKTDKTVIIEGWVPKKNMKNLESTISKATERRYYIEDIATDELAPTLLNRPKILQPFDYMVNFISVPRSDEIDPAIPFIISFPIFYGFMISDVGYGILSFFFAMYIARITNPEGLVHNTAKIWQLSAISAIIFGFLSNQYFGLQLNQYFTTFTGFDWFKSIPTIILVCIIFGVIQVVLGLLLGFFNKYNHHRKMAYSKLTSIALIISGIFAVGGGLFHLFGSTITLVSGVIAILMLIATIILSGEEAGEITNLISHPLSYARIMGFGLASVVLAFLIDQAFTPTLSNGIPWFILSIVMFLVLHFLNMIVSMFEGAVQGARLNFIEFFTKFYTGGGIKFNSIRIKKGLY